MLDIYVYVCMHAGFRVISKLLKEAGICARAFAHRQKGPSWHYIEGIDGIEWALLGLLPVKEVDGIVAIH